MHSVVGRSKISVRRIFLIGFMGAGKTSVGRALAQRLGWRFQDLDELIESRQGKTVTRIFAESGEAAFRGMESEALREVLQTETAAPEAGLVIALGGGAFAQPENREALNATEDAVIVLLEAPIDELRRRCNEGAQGGTRPLASDPGKFSELYRSRRSTYELAQVRVQNVDKTVDQTAEEIEALIAASAGRR